MYVNVFILEAWTLLIQILIYFLRKPRVYSGSGILERGKNIVILSVLIQSACSLEPMPWDEIHSKCLSTCSCDTHIILSSYNQFPWLKLSKGGQCTLIRAEFHMYPCSCIDTVLLLLLSNNTIDWLYLYCSWYCVLLLTCIIISS